MNLNLNPKIAEKYNSSSQIARVLSETWVSENIFCPHCGNIHIQHLPNNTPVGDFYCSNCKCQYELKSKSGALGNKITDGAYDTMIQRITSNHNPDFFFMSYSKENYMVQDFIFIPKHFFTPDIIEKRTPLSSSAQRSGWIGCNILINNIPKQGIIPIVSNGTIIPMESVIAKTNSIKKLEFFNISARGWLLDILRCVNQVHTIQFTLNDIYIFENILHDKHPDNNNIRPKIRQQLQLLRDNGFIEFLGNGIYRKIL